MQIIPVLDVLHGQAVRAVAGRRDAYRPVVSQLIAGSDPLELAAAYREVLGLQSLYLADLDAILHSRPNWSLYQQLREAGGRVWIDAGLRDGAIAEQVLAAGAEAIIVGLETWPGPAPLRDLCQTLGPDRIVFSLDLQAGRCLGDPHAWPPEPMEVAELVAAAGVERLIVLDLAQVGTGTGISTGELCQTVRRRFPELQLITGGGVRTSSDLPALVETGVAAVLVGSAFHDGRLTRSDIDRFTK